MSQKNKENLRSFHHSAIRRILGIIWTRVREERITNKEVTYCFLQIPDIDAFIVWHTVRYVRKVCRSKGKIIPRKLLGAWTQHPWKTGKPQYSCNIYQMIPSDVLTYSGIFVQDTNDVTPCSSGHIGFATLGVFCFMLCSLVAGWFDIDFEALSRWLRDYNGSTCVDVGLRGSCRTCNLWHMKQHQFGC